MKIYKLSVSMDKNVLEIFCQKNNIDIEDVYFLGGGDFGEAYQYNDKVIKITSDEKEFNIAKELIEHKNGPIAKIYKTDIINGDCVILMEKVEQPSEIENLFYEMEALVEENETDMEYLDSDDIKGISKELKEFINEVQWIYRFQRNLGIMKADIKPENLGYNKNGKLVCFDITDQYKF